MSVVITPKIHDTNPMYFMPRFVKVPIGGTIIWTNQDQRDHNLIFERQVAPYGYKIGQLKPGESLSKTFDAYIPRIDYTCALHPEEKGTIIIHHKEQDRSIKLDTLKTDSDPILNNRLQPIKELNGSLTEKNGENLIDVEPDHITLEKFLDPGIRKILSRPSLYQLQSKDMTLVFWDLSRFSILCNELKNISIAIAGLLRQYFDEAVRIIHKHKGIVDKFIGDGILAYFGFHAISKHALGAVDAVNSALELRNSFKKIKSNWIKLWNLDENEINISLKCGIHSGNVLFGLLDTQTRSQITVIGPSVNLASRLEGLAKDSQIIISRDTKELIHDAFKEKSIDVKHIQSFPDIKEVYEIVEFG